MSMVASCSAPVCLEGVDLIDLECHDQTLFQVSREVFLSIHLARLQKIYKDSENIDVVSGMNPFHFNNYRDAAFTHFIKDGENLTGHLGISLWETMLLESFCKELQPPGVYIVGNGLGWSALALSLINPDAAIVVIDPEIGVDLVNRLAFKNGLRCIAVRGYSPADNKAIIEGHFDQPPGLVLIDGNHTNDAILADFTSLLEICGENSFYFFHDIVNFNLFSGFDAITAVASKRNMSAAILASSPSGMAVVYPRNCSPNLRSLVGLFELNRAAVTLISGHSGGTLIPTAE
jgi:hypothetical protein